MNLFEINAAIETAFMNCVDPETGEVIGDTAELDALQIARDEKIENLALFIKNLKAEAAAIREEEKRLADRRRAAENRSEWLKDYLTKNLGGERFSSPRVAVSFRRSESVKIDDLWKIPDQYMRYKDPEPDKTMIKKALKEGETIEGVELVETQNIQIR